MDLKSVFAGEYEAFVRRLLMARRQAGLTQQQLASRLNKHQSFVSKFERRERRLDVLEFVTICRALNIDPCGVIRQLQDDLFEASEPGEHVEA